jgi:hypothetical protein
MFAFAIDCGGQRPKGHATLAGDLLQTVPELAFVLWPAMTIERFKPKISRLLSPAKMKSKEVLA